MRTHVVQCDCFSSVHVKQIPAFRNEDYDLLEQLFDDDQEQHADDEEQHDDDEEQHADAAAESSSLSNYELAMSIGLPYDLAIEL